MFRSALKPRVTSSADMQLSGIWSPLTAVRQFYYKCSVTGIVAEKQINCKLISGSHGNRALLRNLALQQEVDAYLLGSVRLE